MTKLKPVTFVQGKFSYTAKDDFKQRILLKAMMVTQNPSELRRLIGVKSVAEVYRTLDKMAMRKDYHRALADKGISFDYIIDVFKGVIENGEKDADKLKAANSILKSIGMDKYEESVSGGGSWEDLLIAKAEKAKEITGAAVIPKTVEYDVIIPKVPEDVAIDRAKESKAGKSLYE